MDFPNQSPQPTQPLRPTPAPTPTQPVTPTAQPVSPPQPPVFQPTVSPAAPTMMGAPAGVLPPNVGAMPQPSASSVPPVTPTSVQIPVQNQSGQTTVADDQVYTMPDKFLQQTPVAATAKPKKSHKGLTIVLIVIIILALLGIIGGVLFYVLKVLPAQNQTTNTGAVVNSVANDNQTNTVANTNNANVNTNTINVNGNTNKTANNKVNALDNANDNANSNINTNTTTNKTNVNTNTTTNTNTNTNTTTTTPLPSSKDTDADSITNEEEKIWGTKADLPDTDSDGYADGAEVLAGYDPLNPVSSGRLIDGGALGTYANKDYGYDIYYPIDWIAEALSEGAMNEVLFTPDSLDTAGQFVEVIVEDNPTGLTAIDWYVDQTEVDESSLETVTTASGLDGVWSLDGNTAYFATNNNIYAVSYRYGNSQELYFKTTFTMMVRSFALTKKAQSANDAAVNSNTSTNTTTTANTNVNENTNGNTNVNTNTNTTNTNATNSNSNPY